MIKFDRPNTLNGALLIEELAAAGVNVKADISGIKAPFIDGNGDLYIDILVKDKPKAVAVIANHNGMISLA